MIFKDYFSFYIGALILGSVTLIVFSRIGLPGQGQILRNLSLAYLLLFASSAMLFIRLAFLHWKEKLPLLKIINLFFLATLPASIVLFIGTNWLGVFHHLFPIASLFNLLFFLNYLIFLRLKKLKRESSSSSQRVLSLLRDWDSVFINWAMTIIPTKDFGFLNELKSIGEI